jgi:hypothetical protein
MKEEVEIAWSLYLSLENTIERSFEFVYPLIDENKNVVSIPYQQIIFASCSEINNLLNLLMGKYSRKPEDFKKNASMWNIRLFYRALKDESFNNDIKNEIDPIGNKKFYKVLESQSLLDQIKNETVFLDYQLHKIFNDPFKIKPFKEQKNAEHPSWWNAYNNLKHNKTKNFPEANLENAICASSGLLVLIKYIALVLNCSPILFSGTKLMHACKMPRYGATCTAEDGDSVISGGTFPKTNLPCDC